MKLLFGSNVILFFFICSVFGVGWLWSISEKKLIKKLNVMNKYYLEKSNRAIILKQSYYDHSRRKKHIEYINELLYEGKKGKYLLRFSDIRLDVVFILDDSACWYLRQLLFELKENNYQEFFKSENQGED